MPTEPDNHGSAVGARTQSPAAGAPVSTDPHIPALDGLRGFAVMLVFFYHYGGGAQSRNPLLRAVGMVNKAGWCGVTLFFVLSGFLITGILWDSLGTRHWLRNFFMRRVLRIFPLYYAVVLIVLVAGVWQHSLGASSRIALVLATFTQNFPYFQTHGRVPAPIFHLWSIAVEEQFYLLWPVLLLLLSRFTDRRAGYAFLLPTGLFAGSFVFRAVLWRFSAAPELFAQTLLVRGGELAAGAALALAWRSGQPMRHRLQRLAPVACVAFAAVFAFTSYEARSFQLQAPVQWVWGLPAITLSFAALLWTALTPGVVQSIFSLAGLRYIGRISYGIYVFHFLLLHNVNQAAAAFAHGRAGTLYELSRLVIAVVATLAASVASFALLEQPFLRFKRRFPVVAPSGPLLRNEARPSAA